MMNRNMIIATGLGLVAQLAMVLTGHNDTAFANLFAPLGIAISLVAGAVYAWLARQSVGQGALGGAIAGGVCALLGIAVSFALGDVTAFILLAGTFSSAVGGAIGGALVAAVRKQAVA
jgi:hypothetical protein